VPEPERNKQIPVPNALEVHVRIVGGFWCSAQVCAGIDSQSAGPGRVSRVRQVWHANARVSGRSICAIVLYEAAKLC